MSDNLHDDDSTASGVFCQWLLCAKKVSEERGKLGAIQNRLEHTIANLDNTAENLQTAESNIRDTDMAAEMVNYSKNNIRECFFIHAQIWSVHVGTG